MTDISASEARARWAELLRRAASGEIFTIVRDQYPVAVLGPPGLGSDYEGTAAMALLPRPEGPTAGKAERDLRPRDEAGSAPHYKTRQQVQAEQKKRDDLLRGFGKKRE